MFKHKTHNCHRWLTMQIYRSKFSSLWRNLETCAPNCESITWKTIKQTTWRFRQDDDVCSQLWPLITSQISFTFEHTVGLNWHTNTQTHTEGPETQLKAQVGGRARAERSWRRRTWPLPIAVCVCVWQEAAGPLKAKMVSYKLQFLPSVSFLPLSEITEHLKLNLN